VYEVEAEGGERLAAKVVSAGVQGASPSTLQRRAFWDSATQEGRSEVSLARRAGSIEPTSK